MLMLSSGIAFFKCVMYPKPIDVCLSHALGLLCLVLNLLAMVLRPGGNEHLFGLCSSGKASGSGG